MDESTEKENQPEGPQQAAQHEVDGDADASSPGLQPPDRIGLVARPALWVILTAIGAVIAWVAVSLGSAVWRHYHPPLAPLPQQIESAIGAIRANGGVVVHRWRVDLRGDGADSYVFLVASRKADWSGPTTLYIYDVTGSRLVAPWKLRVWEGSGTAAHGQTSKTFARAYLPLAVRSFNDANHDGVTDVVVAASGNYEQGVQFPLILSSGTRIGHYDIYSPTDPRNFAIYDMLPPYELIRVGKAATKRHPCGYVCIKLPQHQALPIVLRTSSEMHILHVANYHDLYAYAPGDFALERLGGRLLIVAGFIYGYPASYTEFKLFYFAIDSDYHGLATIACPGLAGQRTIADSGIAQKSLTQHWYAKAQKAGCVP